MPNHMEGDNMISLQQIPKQIRTSIQEGNLLGGMAMAFGGNLCLLSLSVSTEV